MTAIDTEKLQLVANIPLESVEKMAHTAATSGLFGVKDKTQAFALMLLAQAEGLHPMRAVAQYHIIQGKASMKAEAMLARFQAAGGTVRWVQSDAAAAEAVFTHPVGGSLPVRWTIEQAHQVFVDSWEGESGQRRKVRSKLTDKDNWKNYPAAMLRARCITEGVRAVLPGCTLGILSAEEALDLPPDEPQEPVQEPQRGVAGLARKVEAVVGKAEPAPAQAAPEPTPTTRVPDPVLPSSSPPLDPAKRVRFITDQQVKELVGLLKPHGVETPTQLLQWCTDQLGRQVKGLRSITADELEVLLRAAKIEEPAT